MGTGVGFVGGKPIEVTEGEFVLSREVESCEATDSAGKTSATTIGMYDLDGDGIPEIVDPFSQRVLRLNGVEGVPQAG
jgi:hypothetical protein